MGRSFLADPVRRNVVLLALCQAFFMSVQSASIATTPLAGHMLLGVDKSLATLPIFLAHAGIMATTIPASFLMKRIGRRGGFSVGALFGILSGLISALALYRQDFVLLCVGAVFQGMAAAFAWYFRFAAADISQPAFKAKAISWVMAGGLVAGFMGPQAAKWAVDWFAPLTFMGVYVMVAIFSASVLLIVQALRIAKPTVEEAREGGRPLREIARNPAFGVAILTSMLGYGVMTLVMSTTPLAMQACGFAFSDSASVIQAHVIAMFLPSFFTGHLINRFGVLRIIIVGAVIQASCAVVNLAGIDFMNFFVGLALVGLGWNLTYVGGTTLLTTVYQPAERAKVQGTHDFSVYAMTACAAGLSGFLHHQAGWTIVNLAAFPMMAIVIAAALWLGLRQRRLAAAQAA